VAGEFASTEIHFNLAHTEDLALVAVTRVGALGVDVEGVRPVQNVEDLVARFFSRRENELFQKVSADEKPAAFFNLWTRKEHSSRPRAKALHVRSRWLKLGSCPARLRACSPLKGTPQRPRNGLCANYRPQRDLRERLRFRHKMSVCGVGKGHSDTGVSPVRSRQRFKGQKLTGETPVPLGLFLHVAMDEKVIESAQDEQLMKGQLHRITIWLAGAMLVLGGLYYFFVHRHMKKKA